MARGLSDGVGLTERVAPLRAPDEASERANDPSVSVPTRGSHLRTTGIIISSRVLSATYMCACVHSLVLEIIRGPIREAIVHDGIVDVHHH